MSIVVGILIVLMMHVCQINDAKNVDPRDIAILQARIIQLQLREPEPKETKLRKRKHVPENKIQGGSKISQHEELLVFSNNLDKNAVGGENSKSGRDVHYWNFITQAPMTMYWNFITQAPMTMYWNFITRAPMTLFILRQRMF
jgi:hypothetical protein